MMRKLISIIFFSLLFMIAANADSQQIKPDNKAVEQKANQTSNNKQIINPQNQNTVKTYTVKESITSLNLPKEAYDKTYWRDYHKKWRDIINNPSDIFTGIVAIFTILLVIAGGWQVSIARATTRQLRAYVFVNDISIFNVANPINPLPKDYKKTGAEINRPDDGPIVAMTIKNSGQTPAYEVVNEGHICIQEFPLNSDLPFEPSSRFITKTAIPPGGITTKNLAMRPLTQKEVSQLRNGTMAIYVYGKIIYKDTFGKSRFTNFRVMHFAAAQSIGIGTGLTICEEGNEAN
jgi:hypothetical protein